MFFKLLISCNCFEIDRNLTRLIEVDEADFVGLWVLEHSLADGFLRDIDDWVFKQFVNLIKQVVIINVDFEVESWLVIKGRVDGFENDRREFLNFELLCDVLFCLFGVKMEVNYIQSRIVLLKGFYFLFDVFKLGSYKYNRCSLVYTNSIVLTINSLKLLLSNHSLSCNLLLLLLLFLRQMIT